jgi:hypothetical protein
MLMIALTAAGFVVFAFAARRWIDKPAPPDPLSDCIDVPRSRPDADVTIYTFRVYSLGRQYHVPPALIQALVDLTAHELKCEQPAAVNFVARALRCYGTYDRAAYWLMVEFEAERAFEAWRQKEGKGD